MWTYTTDSMDFVTVSTGLISPYWMGLPIRYIQLENSSFADIWIGIVFSIVKIEINRLNNKFFIILILLL